ncbi:MAG: alpha/beta hydrolase [Methanomicrobiales archaeon]|nr:alpha/beta hydrolase [Methanomicrobiales archaeon]
MQTTITTILFITTCIILTGISGCIESNNAQELELNKSADQKNLSAENLNSSYVMTRDGVPLRYSIHGQGPPVFFVLGYGMTIDEWPHQIISDLAQSHSVIVYNHRGISGVHNPDVPFTIPQAAMDLHDVITKLAGRSDGCMDPEDGLNPDKPVISDTRNCSDLPVDIVGYSMGGMVALEYAKTYPNSVNHLVLLNTDCGGAEKVPAEDWVVEEMGQTLNNPKEYLERAGKLLLTKSFRKSHPDPYTWFVDYGEVADPDAVQQQYDSFVSWSGVFTDLPLIRSRTLVITGDQDIVIPPENSLIIADAIPNATLIIREGQGHGIIFVEPEKIAGIIGEFLIINYPPV